MTVFSTPAQHFKLLVMLSKAGELGKVGHQDNLWDYEVQAINWVNETFNDFQIEHLSSLTKSEIQRCFEELE